MSIFQIFYVSRACEGLAISDVRNILTVAQRNNQYYALTGCLLFTGRHFAQVLEGAVADISDLLMVLAADRRHTDMRVLVNHLIPQRQYPQWSMECFHNPDADIRIEYLLEHPKQILPSAELLALMTEFSVESLSS